MLVMVELKYVFSDKKSGVFKYRRRVSEDLQLALGKKEFVISFKTVKAERVGISRASVYRIIKAA